MLRRPLAIVGFALVLTSCRGANYAGQSVVPAAAQTKPSSGSSGTGTVVVALPPIISGTPVPGAVALSSATKSIAGRIGKTHFGPIALNAASQQCTSATSGLACTLTLTAQPGRQRLSLKTYATTGATGSPLALGSAGVHVYAGVTSYPTQRQWIGIAKRLSLQVTPASLMQGQETAVSAVAYGIDAGGAPIPNPSEQMVNGTAVPSLYALWSGIYYGSTSIKLMVPQSLFVYNGIFNGTERLTLRSNYDRTVITSRILTVTPGTAGSARIFEEGGFVTADPLFGTAQFAAGSSSSATPLRTMFVPSLLTTARDDGSFWALLRSSDPLFVAAVSFSHYDASGNIIEQVPAAYPGAGPANPPLIEAATLDTAGNAYVVDTIKGSPPILNVYAAGAYTSSPTRSITIGSTGVGELAANVQPYMGVDGAGNVYLAYTQCYGCAMYVYEYGPSQTGSATPIRSITVGWLEGLAVDPSGNVYTVDCGIYDRCYMTSALNKYTPGNVETTITGSATHFFSGVATDGSGKVYAVAQSVPASRTYQPEIEIFAPGATTPSQTIVGPATHVQYGLISTQIAVAP